MTTGDILGHIAVLLAAASLSAMLFFSALDALQGLVGVRMRSLAARPWPLPLSRA
jgi:hypothetical protein